MSDSSIALKVFTAEGLALEDEAVSVVAPGARGYVGFLVRHAPLVMTVSPGKLSWRRPGGERRAVQVGSGILEIVKNHLTILTDAVDRQPEEASRP